MGESVSKENKGLEEWKKIFGVRGLIHVIRSLDWTFEDYMK